MEVTIQIPMCMFIAFTEDCRSQRKTPEQVLVRYVESRARDCLGEIADEILGPKEVKAPVIYGEGLPETPAKEQLRKLLQSALKEKAG